MVGIVKHVSSFAARSSAFSLVMRVLERAERQRADLLRVLTYHRVDEPSARPTLHPRLISATPADFDRQIRLLAANYRVLSMRQVIEALAGGRSLPPRAVLITFDDAYRDFAENAWPILQRHGLPVTLFVPTGYPDRPERVFWWDRLYRGFQAAVDRRELDTPIGRFSLSTPARRRRVCDRLIGYVKTLPHHAAMDFVSCVCEELGTASTENHVLSWNDLRRLAGEGVTLGAHSRTHPLMNRTSVLEAEVEAAGSLRDLRREIGQVPPIFAYPAGGLDSGVVRALKREGFSLAFTTHCAINDMQTADPLRLGRINVSRRTTLGILRARLHSWSRCFGRR